MTIPIIDLSRFDRSKMDNLEISVSLSEALTYHGFFYLVGHNISLSLQNDLEDLSKVFFSWTEKNKLNYRMELAGRAWRGYFPVGAELTAGRPDMKEGFYFGQELACEHPMVQAKVALHGSNIFPPIPRFKKTIMEYMSQLTDLGHKLMRLISLSLHLPEDYINKNLTYDPLVLFRIFHYPHTEQVGDDPSWGVAEHTDYGLLTILKQDDCGGLQIFKDNQWIHAPYKDNSFICNIGDMLELITGGLYRSTRHRVLNSTGKSRFSFPFFFDPSFDSIVNLLPGMKIHNEVGNRWDAASPFEFAGKPYGSYILKKVEKVFPHLK